jgi:hypothetical protein
VSPDTLTTIVGVALGIIFVVPTIYMIRQRGYGGWAWPLFLASLPVWYMLFGALALDGTAITLEALVGLPYVITGFIAWRFRSWLMQVVLGLAWLSHGFYDYYHDIFFVNPGVFEWYPAFCAVVDLAVGCFLLYRSSIGDGTDKLNF